MWQIRRKACFYKVGVCCAPWYPGVNSVPGIPSSTQTKWRSMHFAFGINVITRENANRPDQIGKLPESPKCSFSLGAFSIILSHK